MNAKIVLNTKIVLNAKIVLFVGLMIVAIDATAASRVDVFQFDNEVQRARYQALIAELRCPKCLNTNIAGSDSPIAQDLRELVHRFVVVEGRSDQEILSFLQARYGDFVLYDPPFNNRTWILWLLPVVVGAIVLMALLTLRRRSEEQIANPLSEQERAQLAALHEED